VISPLQGFKIAITNLAHSVTQDDIIVSITNGVLYKFHYLFITCGSHIASYMFITNDSNIASLYIYNQWLAYCKFIYNVYITNGSYIASFFYIKCLLPMAHI
jgi:hypothetical protein